MPLMAEFDQRRSSGDLDVVGADPLEHVAEEVELAIGVGRGRIGRAAGEQRVW